MARGPRGRLRRWWHKSAETAACMPSVKGAGVPSERALAIKRGQHPLRPDLTGLPETPIPKECDA